MISIRDQANPGSCIQASTTPTLGKLYPISGNLFVDVGGNVGIGTTTPGAKLEVAGSTQITDTLTLNPSGDQALDVSTGSIYKGGALFIHTKGGSFNTALGEDALVGVTTGSYNTAAGRQALTSDTTGMGNTATGAAALRSNTTGNHNTAIGNSALRLNTTGYYNTASGSGALRSNTTGYRNTASGHAALYYNTTGVNNTASGTLALLYNTTGYNNTASGDSVLGSNTTGCCNTASGVSALVDNTTGDANTASGYRALFNNSTGSNNIALGNRAGNNLTTGSDNIAIGNQGVAGEGATIRIGTDGTHTRTFIAGIHGTAVTSGSTVMINSSGQLGTVVSSRRFKEEIRDMGDLTESLLELRPVVFRYKPQVQQGERPLEYGLIAEEVAEVFPDLVVYDEEGKPFTVKYHLLSSMLLSELKKLHERLEARDAANARDLESLRAEVMRLRGLEARLGALESCAKATTTQSRVPPANF